MPSDRGGLPLRRRGEALGQHLHGAADLLLGMLGGDEEPDPRQAFRHGRIEDRLGVDALAEQRGGDAERIAPNRPE